MAQTENNGTEDVKVYSKGNDENVDLKEYVNILRNKYDEFERNAIGKYYRNSKGKKVKIEEKHIPLLRQAYSEMLHRVASGDNSFTAKLEGGFFDRSEKITNGSDFDNYGIIASFFGQELRKMKSYTAPKPAADPSKVEYGDGALGKIIMNRYAGKYGTVQDIQNRDRDPNNPNAKITSNAVRSSDLYGIMTGIKGELDGEGLSDFLSLTPEQRQKVNSDLEELFTVFGDNKVTPDEYLKAKRILGWGDQFDQMMAIGDSTVPVITNPDGTVTRPGRTYADKIRAIYKKWKPYTGALDAPITIGAYDVDRWGPNVKQAFTDLFKSASNADLTDLLRATFNPNYDLNTHKAIIGISRQHGKPFSDMEVGRNFLRASTLNALKERTPDNTGGLYAFGDSNPGLYYIHGTDTERNTGWVWDSNTNTLNEMSIHDIPYWQQYINNWWNTQEDSYEEELDPTLTAVVAYRKKGGILYADSGAVMNRIGVAKGSPASSWLAIENTLANQSNLELWNNYYKNADIDAAIAGGNRFYDNGYNTWAGANTVHGLTASQLGDLLNQLNTLGSTLPWEKKLNDLGYEEWNKVFDKTGLNTFFGGDSNKFKYLGPSTWNRHELLNRLQLTYNEQNPLKVGDEGVYFDGSTWKTSVKPSVSTDPSSDAIAARKAVVASTKSPTALTGEQLFGKGSSTDETLTFTSPKKTSSGFFNTVQDLAPLGLRAFNLFDALNTNKKNREGLRFPLALESNWFVPYARRGDFTAVKEGYRSAADIASRMRPFTSNATDYQMGTLEAWRAGRAPIAKGWEADRAERRRSEDVQWQAENRFAKDQARIAFGNDKAISEYNYQNSAADAKYRIQQQKSRAAFVDELSSQIKDRNDKRLAFEETVADDSALRYYNDLRQQANNALLDWQGQKAGNTLANWADRNKYTRFLAEAENRLRTARLSGRAGVYRYHYDNPYSGEKIPFSWASFAKNGGTLRPKVDYIAQIIKLNNERNS